MSRVTRTLSLPLFGLLLVIAGCERTPDDPWPGKPGPKVLTSFPAIHCFALNVVGDDGTVRSLLSSQGAHHAGDVPSHQMKLAHHAHITFINGLGVDNSLANRIKAASGNPSFKLVDLGDRIDKAALLEGVCHHDHGHDGHHEDHGTDPHVWLSAKHARTMVAAIRDEISKQDSANAAKYEERARIYLERLEQLERDGIKMLKDKTERKIITFHDSLQYFAQCYGLTIVDSIQIEPGREPPPKHLERLIAKCKEHKVRLIAVEPQFPRNTSAKTVLDALRKEGIDAEFVEIDPLETADESEMKADLYEKKMRTNLENLAKKLK